MKKIVLNLFLAFVFVNGLSQTNSFIYPDFIGETFESINNNLDWKILVNAKGDLNNDNLEDLALVLESKDSVLEKRCTGCKILKQKPRVILVLINEDNTPKVIVQNNKFIARGDEGGMATYIEPELSIEDGLLTIFYEYTRSNQSYTFKKVKNNFKIVSAKSMYVHAASGNYENDEFDFLNNKIISKTGNISLEGEKIEVLEIKVKPKGLSEFGEMYEWEVVENKYL
ncbi:hypothetical protein [Hanstruepera flava]|uniref:hypothetical protein n=1 Tax=Hanstruepera flava TaxID=2930218 RepID=UPI0020277B94|nr:hypothetical protein [Hanstruepera flava]